MTINPSYTFEDLMTEFIGEGDGGPLGVSMPGRVVSYDRATQRASIQPCITRRMRSSDDEEVDVFERPPVLPSVPVVWPSGGDSFMHPSLSAGDPVLLVVSDADFAGWAASGNVSDPSDDRVNHYAHSFAIPGPRPRSAPLPSGRTVFQAEGDAQALAVAELVSSFLTQWMAQAVATGSGATTGVEALTALQTALETAQLNPAYGFASSRYKQDAEPVLP